MHVSQLLIGVGLFGLGLSLSTCNSTLAEMAKIDLSTQTSIRCGEWNQRWSDYAAPQPGLVVTVGHEDDVAKIITVANKKGAPFLIQSGANGWANTFKLDSRGIIIDVSNLKGITFNTDKSQVTIQTGVTNEDVINAAWNNNARVSVSTCNCVSVLGATLGGGLSRTQGVYGLNIDQLISLNIVDSNGAKKTITKAKNPELWWAVTGAGANFGIVTSGTYKSHAIPQAQNTAWTGLVIFDESKLEQLIAALNALTLEPEMQMDFYFTANPLDGKPTVLFLPFYLGSEEVGRQKFASVLNIGPTLDGTEVIPYNTWNSAGDAFCTAGGRKPSYTTGLKKLDPAAWRNVWNEYTAFFNAHEEANLTTILTECYSTVATAKSVVNDGSSSYPFRDIKCHAIVIPWYTSPSLDCEANKFGKNVRKYWAASAGTSSPSAYINFAHGDEALSQIYGSSLATLQKLKAKYDPKKRLNQWFPLS
ncbi:putative FAD binding domain-containing protein [Rosellinia necatrix]|uniref:Putative FAD binding domain-containing protein n=1 Tax=Rosellinia necatrix TaxID=77044 RepID=A0A1W2TWN2_ROSNE|nr:putative FAD binding domain-containing protein [Rosellinia necatrix]